MPLLLHPPLDSRKHRAARHRTALVALVTLVAFSCYLLLIAYPSVDRADRSLLAHVPDRYPHDEDLFALPDATPPHRKLRPMPPARAPLPLSPHEELAALSAFIAALPHNVLPSFVDPSSPLDPQLVLDFDPRSDTAREELSRVVDQVWARFPVMLYTKLHSSDSREVRNILSSMGLKPAPLVVEVDQRQDAHVLLPLLTRLTHVPTLPVLLIGGQAVGTDASDLKGVMTEIRKLHESGQLARRILEAGSTMDRTRIKGMANKRRSD